MGCGCRQVIMEASGGDGKAKTTRNSPVEQCIFCAQKHADEAFTLMHEYSYSVENRSYIHGSIRAVILHTFRKYPEIAALARKCALLWQGGRTEDAKTALKDVLSRIDETIFSENPELR